MMPRPMAQERETQRSTIGTLRLLLVATIALPLLLGAGAAYLSYVDTNRQATAAASEAVAAAAANTAKVLDTHLLVAARIGDLLGTMRDDQIRAAEKSLHESMAQQIAAMPQVAAAWVIDAAGRELVSARVYPVNPGLDQSDRADYRALRDTNVQNFIWILRARRLEDGEFEPYFTVSLRRVTPDGRFNGVIVVAVASSYFASFYDSLIGSGRYTAALLKSDGVILARYPAPNLAAGPPLPDPLLIKAITEAPKTGIVENGTPFDGAGRIVAVKRVGNYPVYVTIERRKASILGEWLQTVSGYAAIGIPAAIALIALSALAFRRARREELALARAGRAFAGRAALEVRLHRAQRLEALGLLTTGIANAFAKAVSEIRHNVEHAAAAIDNPTGQPQPSLAAAQDGCTRAAGLAQRLLSLTRSEPLRPQPTDLNEVIVDLLELTWPSGTPIFDEVRLQEGLWPVQTNPDQLATALLGFAFHAQSAPNADGQLVIEASNCSLDAAGLDGAPPGDYVELIVEGAGAIATDAEDIRDLVRLGGFADRASGYGTIEGTPGGHATMRIHLPRYRAEKIEPTSAVVPQGTEPLGLVVQP